MKINLWTLEIKSNQIVAKWELSMKSLSHLEN